MLRTLAKRRKLAHEYLLTQPALVKGSLVVEFGGAPAWEEEFVGFDSPEDMTVGWLLDTVDTLTTKVEASIGARAHALLPLISVTIREHSHTAAKQKARGQDHSESSAGMGESEF